MKHPKRKPKAAAKPGTAKKKRRILPKRKSKAAPPPGHAAGPGHGHGQAPAPAGKKPVKGKIAHPKPRTVAA